MNLKASTCTFSFFSILSIAMTSCYYAHSDSSSVANSAGLDVQYFDPSILRKNVTEAPQHMLPSPDGAVNPLNVSLDTEDGKYIGATITYPKTIGFEPMRLALSRLYDKYEVESFADNPEMGLWRNEDDQFAIHLTANDDGIQVIYLAFQPTQKVLENMFRTNLQGSGLFDESEGPD